jgi:glucose-6-phosphate isomerase
MPDQPVSTIIVKSENLLLEQYDNHIKRHLSDMKGMFLNKVEYQGLLDEEDRLLYEVYEMLRPEIPGELLYGLSIVHPGLVGDEYYMTKGHFHAVLDTAEIYHCLRGSGVMVMETPEGESAIQELEPGRILYVPPRWAHRSVNTSFDQDLVTFFIYPANAGHDYGSIEYQGFRKLVVNQNGRTRVMNNPSWLPPEERE